MLLWIPLALAGVVTDVPPGETRVDLVVCRDDNPCAQMAYAVELLPEARGRAILPLDQLLERDGGEWEDGEKLGARFDGAMDRARAAWAAGRFDDAARALEDADAALDRWSGTADPQRLFDLAYLKGAVALQRKEDPEADFRQAAAVAWNRTVALPVEDPAGAAYYAVLDRLVGEGTGTLRFDAPPDGATWHLDGVALGEGPAEVTVFPGVHRVTATHAGKIRTWKRDVQVHAGRVRPVSAAFSPADDASWVRARVREAFDTRSLPKEVRELLTAWCERKNVAVVRFVTLDGSVLRTATYDVALRRME
ncbi:MAG: hypothetical protein ACK4YP_15250 [Myxococcota bacterium]